MERETPPIFSFFIEMCIEPLEVMSAVEWSSNTKHDLTNESAHHTTHKKLYVYWAQNETK